MNAAWCTPRAVDGGRSASGRTSAVQPSARVAKSAAIRTRLPPLPRGPPPGRREPAPDVRLELRFADVVPRGVAQLAHPPYVLTLGPAYDAAVAARPLDRVHAPCGDDLLFLYTGGTTGMPKGVMWRADDLYAALWQMGRPGSEPPDPLVAVRAGKRAATTL